MARNSALIVQSGSTHIPFATLRVTDALVNRRVNRATSLVTSSVMPTPSKAESSARVMCSEPSRSRASRSQILKGERMTFLPAADSASWRNRRRLNSSRGIGCRAAAEARAGREGVEVMVHVERRRRLYCLCRFPGALKVEWQLSEVLKNLGPIGSNKHRKPANKRHNDAQPT